MARGNQIVRQWAVIKTLDGRPKGITIPEISRDLHCCFRKIYRGLDDLSKAGVPNYND